MRIPPSVAFYVANADEMDALWELDEERPEDVSAEDWAVLRAVIEKLDAHIASLVLDCRAAAEAAISKAAPKLHIHGRSSPAASARHWNAWLYVAPSPAKLDHSIDLGFVVRRDPQYGVAVVPTVVPRGGKVSVDPTLRLFSSHGIAARSAGGWTGFNCAALEGTPLTPERSFEELATACAQNVRSIVPRFPELFEISKRKGRDA